MISTKHRLASYAILSLSLLLLVLMFLHCSGPKTEPEVWRWQFDQASSKKLGNRGWPVFDKMILYPNRRIEYISANRRDIVATGSFAQIGDWMWFNVERIGERDLQGSSRLSFSATIAPGLNSVEAEGLVCKRETSSPQVSVLSGNKHDPRIEEVHTLKGAFVWRADRQTRETYKSAGIVMPIEMYTFRTNGTVSWCLEKTPAQGRTAADGEFCVNGSFVGIRFSEHRQDKRSPVKQRTMTARLNAEMTEFHLGGRRYARAP